MKLLLCGALAVCAIPGISSAQSLREQLADTGVADHWTYNDWESAKTAAKREGKPIFALFR